MMRHRGYDPSRVNPSPQYSNPSRPATNEQFSDFLMLPHWEHVVLKCREFCYKGKPYPQARRGLGLSTSRTKHGDLVHQYDFDLGAGYTHPVGTPPKPAAALAPALLGSYLGRRLPGTHVGTEGGQIWDLQPTHQKQLPQ